ncbi:hypothetical protein GH714_035450 [Hevea brasiliensis]|uniref:ribonuclease Z n=1 Tax=Hevea brasiliensis TaxID=3981 RepID=A0A6A6NCZ8_HEVBR|nr:hypothetical protein GH714_035450 [Hevea brasiliensis]
MEDNNNETFGFNKRRAEGRDKSDKPKRNLQLKTRKLNPTNTISYVQLVILAVFLCVSDSGTGMDTQDTSPSVLLFFDKQRFIFNAGEGLQRFCTEHKIKLSKIDHIFLSRVCSETAGGIPGLLLTLAGMGEEGMSVNVWGPSDLQYLVDAMKSFIPHAAMVHTTSFGSDSKAQFGASNFTDPIDIINNEVVKISAILLRPSCSEGAAVKPGDMSVIYLCELPEIMGKFDPEKQKLLVHPSDVMVLQFLVLLYFLLTAQQNLMYKNYCPYSPLIVTMQITQENVEIPILRSSARIAARLNYLCPQFFPAPGFWSLKQLNSSKIDSIFSGEDCVSKFPESILAENLLKFTLRPHAHLGMDKSNIPSLMSPTEVIEELVTEIPEIVDAAQHVRRFWLGSGETKGDLTLGQDNKLMIEEPWLGENALPSCLENIRRDDLEIVLLGTGSSQPSKYRNVSSVYINLFSKGGLLLDCGEGTLGQLKRRYGVEGADIVVRNLRCIWISHIHADHHTGLARILALRRDLLKGLAHEPLLVVGPSQLKRFLDAYQRLEDLDMQFLDCRSTNLASWEAYEGNSEYKDCSTTGSPNNLEDVNKPTVNTESTLFARCSRMQSYWKRPGSPVDNAMIFPVLKSLKKVLGEAGLEALISFPVVHCPQAFGIVLKAAERINSVGKMIPGWKIVYSGDTRPCPELVEASNGATVLIHEATFEDDLVEEAVARNHSTTKEAIEVGNSAAAYRIILTHFSQRYPKIPVFDETHMHKTCIAFDMMSVNMADLPVLPRVLPYLKLLFKNETIVDELDDVTDAVNAVY